MPTVSVQKVDKVLSIIEKVVIFCLSLVGYLKKKIESYYTTGNMYSGE